MSRQNNKPKDAGNVEDISSAQQMKVLTHQLFVKEKEIQELKSTIGKYKERILSLENENARISESLKLAFMNENKMKLLKEKFEKSDEQNHQLSEEIKRLNKEFLAEKETLIKESEDKVNKAKISLELMGTKLETVHNLEKVVERQEATIKGLEEDLIQKERNYRDKLDQKKLKNSMRFYNLKQKMMGEVESAQKSVDQLNLEQIDIASKLTLLQNHQLMVEIEFQNHQCEELSKKNELLEKQNFEMSRDLEIHKQVEVKVSEKNRELKKKVEELESLVTTLRSGENDLKEKIAQIKLNDLGSRNIDKENGFKSKVLETSLTNTGRFETSEDEKTYTSNKKEGWEKKLIMLEKRYERKARELELLSIKFTALQDRMSNIEKNFHQIITIIEGGLSYLSEDDAIKFKTEFHFDVNNLKNIEFSDLSKEKQYSLLCILLKNFSSILNIEVLSKFDRAKNSSPFFNEVKLNFSKNNSYKENQYLKNTLLTSIKSPYSFFSVTRSGLKVDLPKIDKKVTNFPKNINITSSYLNTK